ncbi:hypothetical protein PAXINDRAFT_20468 [Paxillus involutus ATCC 200175]|uniref:Uncharacterized protein n=1 Tax=Paxillus involutus ATCC 200175 TaxID=664439 RepID=A0A0C9T4L0_PAXIN|nr:hypothetical protein PAXINDRAFT_20468 [Paxillus involutus ATCC 200175]
MPTQLEGQPVVGADTERVVDPLPAITPQDLTAEDKGIQKESNPDTAPTEGTDCAPIPTLDPKTAASAGRSKHKARGRVYRIRQSIMQQDRQEHAYIAKLQDCTIFTSVRGPPLDEIERGCCFHFLLYIFYGQRDPNINPGVNNTRSSAQLSPSDHGAAQRNPRSLGARLVRLLVRLHLRKPPPASASASLSAVIPSTSSPHADPNSASAPATVPLPNQCPPAIVITSPVNTTEVPVHSEIPASPSQTPSPPEQVIVSSASVVPDIDADGPLTEIEPNPWQLTDSERVDSVFVGCMVQLDLEDPWRNP